jgi:hypothetical protein
MSNTNGGRNNNTRLSGKSIDAASDQSLAATGFSWAYMAKPEMQFNRSADVEPNVLRPHAPGTFKQLRVASKPMRAAGKSSYRHD